MKKELKIIFTLLISVFILNLNANAATGTGICYKKTINSSGYCEMEKPATDIYGKKLENTPITSTDKNEPVDFVAAFGYTGKIEGKKQDLICLDSNLHSPGGRQYPYARPFNLNEDYDVGMAKIYQLYINDVVKDMEKGVSMATAIKNHEQIVNVAMRAITYKYKNYITIDKEEERRKNIYGNVINQFEEKKLANKKLPSLVKKGEGYDTARKYYCAGLLACKSCKTVDKNARTVCEEIVKPSKTTEFKFSFENDPKKETTKTIGSKFEKTLTIKLKGLDKLVSNYSLYKITNPSFVITKVSCSDNKLSCSLANTGLLDENLVSANVNGEYELKVIVSGESSAFKNSKNVKVLFDYKTYHILDADNFATLRYSLTETKKQRMIALMPTREKRADAKIKINVPAMCQTEIINGVQIYKYAGKEVSETEYLRADCCSLDPNKLIEQGNIEHYMNKCTTADTVILDTKCDNDRNPNNMSESLIIQQPIDKIMGIVDDAENNYNKGSYTSAQKKSLLDETNNNRDDVYLYNGNDVDSTAFSTQNTYCKMYTSENLKISFPGTVEASSGRFFIFDENQQPNVEGEIHGNFHTDYDRWKKDYEKAIEAEEAAYTAWENAKNKDDAISSAVATPDRTCTYDCDPYSCPLVTGGKPVLDNNDIPIMTTCWKTCSDSYTSYSGTAKGTYYNAKGGAQDKESAYWETSSNCSGVSKPNARVSSYKSSYDAAIKYRKDLEVYKRQCESKSQVSSKWRYYLEPDLKFTYKQEYYDSKTDKVIKTQEEVELEVSTRAEKYWPNISTEPRQTYQAGGTSNDSIIINYGGGRTAFYQNQSFDANKDYRVSYSQKLFYMPKTKYYSLLPNGKFSSDVINYQSGSYIDVGYVFNVEITNYKNEYYTWFSMDNVGHLMRNVKIKPKMKSNTQRSLDAKLEELNDPQLNAIYRDENIDENLFNNICYYTDEEILYKRDCPTCEDEKSSSFRAQYYYRTVANNNLFPNEGISGRQSGANWSNDKGKSAKQAIEKLSEAIYNDQTKEHLEYSFTLSPVDMQKIRELNKSSTYNDFNLKCNEYGKECESQLLEEWARISKTEDILYNTRTTKWKYYVANQNTTQWLRGQMKNILPNGYPEEITKMSNWP